MDQWKGVCEDEPVLKALLEQRFTAPTEIQKRAVPEVLRGNDVIGAAETVRGENIVSPHGYYICLACIIYIWSLNCGNVII